jgi:hypothetical protein
MNEGIDIYTFERSNNNEVSYIITLITYKFLEPK